MNFFINYILGVAGTESYSDFLVPVWVSLASALAILIVLFILIRRSKLRKLKTRSKVMLVVGIFVIVASVGSYVTLLDELNQRKLEDKFSDESSNIRYSSVSFPTTGLGATSRTLVQSIRSLYQTPFDGLVTTFFITLITFMAFKVIRPSKRQIEKDLEEARTVSKNVHVDLEAEKAKLALRIKELETLNKIMVGREVKMVELKKEIEELKKKNQ